MRDEKCKDIPGKRCLYESRYPTVVVDGVVDGLAVERQHARLDSGEVEDHQVRSFTLHLCSAPLEDDWNLKKLLY